MTNQLETAKEWLSDLNKIIDKTDNECTKKKRDVLEYLVQQAERVGKLEDARWKDVSFVKRIRAKNKCYKQALEEIKRMETVTTALTNGQVAYTGSGHIARKALEGDLDE